MPILPSSSLADIRIKVPLDEEAEANGEEQQILNDGDHVEQRHAVVDSLDAAPED